MNGVNEFSNRLRSENHPLFVLQQMGGTSNPNEEQLALVTARVIEIASAISETAASLDGSGYFEDSGFDDEERGAALSARLLEYCGSVEELDPNIDDHPQPRRMARYLLENVEFEVLQAPLPSALLTREPRDSSSHRQRALKQRPSEFRPRTKSVSVQGGHVSLF